MDFDNVLGSLISILKLKISYISTCKNWTFTRHVWNKLRTNFFYVLILANMYLHKRFCFCRNSHYVLLNKLWIFIRLGNQSLKCVVLRSLKSGGTWKYFKWEFKHQGYKDNLIEVVIVCNIEILGHSGSSLNSLN